MKRPGQQSRSRGSLVRDSAGHQHEPYEHRSGANVASGVIASGVVFRIGVIKGRADRTRVRELDKTAESVLPNWRPDLLGSTRIWDGDAYTEVAYFTSSALRAPSLRVAASMATVGA